MNAADLIEKIKKLSAEEQMEVLEFLRADIAESKLADQRGGEVDGEFKRLADQIFNEQDELFRKLAE